MKKEIFHLEGKTRAEVTRLQSMRFYLSCNALLLTLLLGLLISPACKKDNGNNEPVNVVDRYTTLSPQTRQELKDVQTATARYKDLRHAVADGYTDISIP